MGKPWASRVPSRTVPRYKIYRRHNCVRKHRTFQTAAKCIWPRAAWVQGEGRFALLAYCRVLTVSLHETAEAAEDSKAFIDEFHCGGMCYGRHEVLELDLEVG